jgi:hypothetical protein
LGMNIYRVRRGANSILVNTTALIDFSLEDMQYAAENGLVLSTKNAQWWK